MEENFRRILIIVIIIILLFCIFSKNKKENFTRFGQTTLIGESGVGRCRSVVGKNYNGASCCGGFNNEGKYGKKCCTRVDGQNNCIEWSGTY